MIKDAATIQKIIDYGIEEVYINTDYGLDVPDTSTKDKSRHDTAEESDSGPGKKPAGTKPVPLNEEIVRAKKIKDETMKTMKTVLDDVKLGKPLEKERIEQDVAAITESVLRNKDALIGLGRLRNIHEYTYGHSLSVCILMVAFARYLGFDSRFIQELGIGALLHDIGTIHISPQIVNKNTKLSEAEYETIKRHVEYGWDILEKTSGMGEISMKMAYQHHERLDGTGYPNGLKSDEISLHVQALGIVDVYDAVTTKKRYRASYQPTEALKMLYKWGGTRFDSSLVKKFIRCIGIFPAGSLVSLESGLLGVVINQGTDDLLKPTVRIVMNINNNRVIGMPYDIDLSKQEGRGSRDRIMSYESPEKWSLQPEMYL